MGCFYSHCSNSIHPLFFCHHTRMRVLSLKSTLTQHAYRRSRFVWRHAHEDESTHIQRRGSHAGEWKQITGSEERRNTDQTLTEPALPLQQRETTVQTRGEQCRAINQHCSCQLLNRLCDESFRSTRVCNPAELWQGLTWWMLLLSQHRITKEHKLSLKLLPAGIHKVFQQQSSQHSLTPTLWESADRGRGRTSRQTPQ